MNEEEFQELRLLKSRQAELLGELAELGRRLDAFEKRVSAPAAQPVPTPVTPKPEPIPVPAPAPAPAPKPATPLPVPPVIPRQSVPPPPAKQPRPAPQPVVPDVATIAATAQTTSTPEPSVPPRMTEPAKKGSFEMRVGTYWLVRIGIVMLLTGLVFFGSYAYQNFIPKLGAGGKIALLYLASGTLLAVGTWLLRKQESLRNYAQVLVAGGLASVYFTTYAAHHFPHLEIIHSAVLDGVLLLGWAGFMIWIANRKKSEVLALFAVLLAYYTSVITHAGLFTLYSNLVLTAAAVFFLVRNRWATVSFASLAATYLAYAYWRFFHAGQWQWANPDEGLWTGNYFLMAYWLVFSAAVFLSRHETFNGERRAGFLSTNNAAFFTAFLLTMFQVRHGGFWKFSLIYGAVLLGLSAVARRLLIKDKLASDAYLTQGLLLVTLGFLTHFTGFKLSLVLAVESVILVQLGQMLRSRVMQTGSIITGGLAAIWVVATMQPFERDGLLTGIAIGGLMLYNAFCLRLRSDYGDSATHPRTLFYTALSLVVWFAATWDNCQPQWRGLALAGESTAFLLAARPLSNQALRYGAWLFACVALGWQANHLGSEWQAIELSQRTGLPQAVAVGALLIFNALWEQRTLASTNKQIFQPPVTFFSVLGLAAWLLATVVFTPPVYRAPLLSLEALALTAAWYPVRLKEFAVFGQVFLLLAQAFWLHDATMDHLSRPWWNPATVIAITLALAAWWQRQKSLPLDKSFLTMLQGVYALAVVGLLFFWLEPQFSGPVWLAFASVLAVVVTLYALFNRFWLLAAAGQFFMLVSAWQFCRQLWNEEPAWFLPLVPIAAFCILSLGALRWFQRRPGAKAEIREPILGLALAYRLLALLMSLWWIHKYIPARENFWVLAAVGLALFFVAGWRRNRELLWFSAAFTAVGIAKFAFPMDNTPTVYWPNFLAILAVLGEQQFARRIRDHYQTPGKAHTTVIVVGGLCLWLLVSRWILQQTSGFYLTVGWSILALFLFIGGMASRERVYRWLGLAVLACALGRVVIFDVWKLETLYRIFTFLALGLVLLILGFIYNRYQEKIKEWL